MALTAEEMTRITKQVVLGEEPPDNESAEAANYRVGVTLEIQDAERIATERGLPFEVVLPSEHQEMWD